MTLDDEFSSYDFDRAEQYLKLKACPPEAIDWAAAVNALPMSMQEYTPTADAGQGMIALPVSGRGGDMTNIVAFEPNKPAHWYFRRPYGIETLGFDQLLTAKTYRTKLVVHDTPLSWLMSNCVGCCPLTEDAYELFVNLPEISAPAALHKKIIKRLELSFVFPKNAI